MAITDLMFGSNHPQAQTATQLALMQQQLMTQQRMPQWDLSDRQKTLYYELARRLQNSKMA